MKNSRHDISAGGFSLIELLTVIAIIGLMVGLTVPAFQSIAGSKKVPSAAGEIAGILEYARNEAMTRQTYVWVGFQNVVTESNNRELRVAAFASDDGTSLGSRYQVSRMFKIPGVMLSSFASLQPDTRSLVPSDVAQVVQSLALNALAPLPALQAAGTTFERVLTFSPGGEALLVPNATSETRFTRLVDVSLRATRGANEPEANADDATVLVGGSSGKVEVIYRR